MTEGSTLNLECVVRDEPPITIWWWLNGTKLDLHMHRGGVFIETYHQKTSSTSKLSVFDFTHADAGLYECRAEKPGYVDNYSVSTSVSVIVIDPSNAPLFSDPNLEYMESAATSVKLCMMLLVISCVM